METADELDEYVARCAELSAKNKELEARIEKLNARHEKAWRRMMVSLPATLPEEVYTMFTDVFCILRGEKSGEKK